MPEQPWAAHVYVPRYHDHSARLIDAVVERQSNQPPEGVSLNAKGNWSGFIFNPSLPSVDHWTVAADERYVRFVSSFTQARDEVKDLQVAAQQSEV